MSRASQRSSNPGGRSKGPVGRTQRVACQLCGARLNPANLDYHLEKVHPGGRASTKDRQALLKRKAEARRHAFRKATKVALPVAVVVLLLGSVYYLALNRSDQIDEAPAWRLEDTEGKTWDSDDYYPNGLTLVAFIHTENRASHEMANPLFDIYDNYYNFDKKPENEGKLTKMFTIGGYKFNDTRDDVDTLDEFTKFYGSRWPYLYDRTGKLMEKYGFEADDFPAFVLVKKNRVVFSHAGKISFQDLAKEIERQMGPPSWKLKDTQDNLYDSADYYGRGLTLVEFMHTECPTCQNMAPVFNDIYTNYASRLKGMFSIGGYALHGHVDDRQTMSDFQNEHASPWPHLIDVEGKLMDRYNLMAYPGIVLIKDNVVVYSKPGGMSYSELANLIEQYL